jgi:SlyX protein
MDTRLVDLESKFAFLEQTVDDLNDVVLEQGREIERLRRQVAELESRVATKPEEGAESEADPLEERPPHY